MADNVKLLRQYADEYVRFGNDAVFLADDAESCADEIERLREALRFYACTCAKGGCNDEEKEYPGCGSKARTALGEKD